MYKEIIKANCVLFRLIVLVFVATIFVGLPSVINAPALTRYDLAVEEYDVATSETYFGSINLKSSGVLETNAPKIYNMDVSKSGKIALSLKSFAEKSVAVFDENGDLLKTFSFDADGSVYVSWNDENLVLLYARGDTAFEITLDGKPVNVYSYDPGTSIYRTLEQNRIEMNGCVYEVKRGSVLTKTDPKGQETVIYESMTRVPNGLIYVCVFIIAYACIAWYIFRQCVKYRQKEPNEQRGNV